MWLTELHREHILHCPQCKWAWSAQRATFRDAPAMHFHARSDWTWRPMQDVSEHMSVWNSENPAIPQGELTADWSLALIAQQASVLPQAVAAFE